MLTEIPERASALCRSLLIVECILEDPIIVAPFSNEAAYFYSKYSGFIDNWLQKIICLLAFKVSNKAYLFQSVNFEVVGV